MLPAASAATPSAALVPLIFSTGSGMRADTTPVLALPTRMPRFHPSWFCATDRAKPEQDLGVGTELDDLLALAVAIDAIGRPDIALAIDVQPMRKHQKLRAEALQQSAGGIELENGRELGPVAIERLAFLH